MGPPGKRTDKARAPHYAPKDWIAKYKGQFDQGWDQGPRGDARPTDQAWHANGVQESLPFLLSMIDELLAWLNLEAQLRAAGMTLDSLVKITTIVPSLADLAAHREMRAEVLGNRKPASTLIVGGLANPARKVEIEGIAQPAQCAGAALR